MKQTFKFLTLFLLTLLGTSNLWATNYTVYFSPQLCGKSWSNPYVGCDPGWDGWHDIAMTSTGKTFHGFPVYSATIHTHDSEVNVNNVQFHVKDKWDSDNNIYGISGWGNPTSLAACAGKICTGKDTWDNYTPDTQFTLYFVKSSSESSWGTPWVNVKRGYNHWANVEMTSTGKTYNGSTIYSATIPAQGFDQIEFHKSENNYDNKVTAASSWTTSVNEKIYANVSSSWAWRDYNYDVTLTFKDGATTVDTKTTLKSGSITAPAAPSKTGYTFQGWGTDKVAAGGTISNVQADATYEAQWSPITYTIAYAGNDNTGGSTASSTHTYDVAKALTANGFTRAYTVTYEYDGATGGNSAESATANYTFTHWTCSANANTYTDGQSVTNLASTQDATVTMTAQWNSGSVTLPTPTKTGYNFSGWYNSSSKIGDAGDSYTPTADITLTAHWTAKQTTITLDGNGATTAGSPTQITATYGQPLPALESFTAPEKGGYNFKGYYSETSGGTQYYNNNGARVYSDNWANEDATATFYAQWENTATYSLTVNVNPSAAFTAHSDNVEGITTLGQSYDISATLAEKGYTFTGWTAEPEANASFADASALSTTVTVNNGSVTVTANAVAYTTTLKLWNNDGTQNYREETATYGQSISVSSIERTGYKYGGYVTLSDGGGAQFILIAGGFSSKVDNWIENNKWARNVNGETKELYAKWTAQYWTNDISKNYQDAGASNGKYKATYDATSIEITTPLVPRAGYTLMGYAISNGGAKVANIDGTLIADVDGWTNAEGKWINTNPGTLYAIWEEVLTTVSLSTNPVGVANILIGGTINTSAQVGVTTNPAISTGASIDNTAFTFKDWTLTNCSIVSNKLVGDGVSAEGSAVANFTLTSCKMRWSKTSSTFYDADGEPEMSYDIEKKAYYIDITPTASPIYFRFKMGDAEWSADWDGTSPNIKTAVVNGSKLDCNQDVHEWQTRATVKYAGCSSYPIRVWFDVKNKKTWITADAEQQWSIAGSAELGEWSTSQKVMTHKESGALWNLTVNLKANTNYELKVVNRATGEYYGSTETITKTGSTTNALATSTSNNLKLTTNVAGNYQFQWSTGTKKLTVTYPTSYAVNFGKGTGGATVTAKIDNTTDITSGELVISGSSVTFAQTAATGYTFKEWNTKQDGTGNQLSTDASYITTINATTNVYAIYTENMHTNIAVVSSDENKGTVNVATVSFGITTGATITATPKAGYYVASWTLPEHAEIASGEGTGTITVKASGDEPVSGTITANFAERWVLRGSRSTGSENEGMPGFSTTTDVFTFAADATEGTKTVTLLPNREYKFMVYDKKHNAQRGYKDENQTLPANTLTGTMNGEYHILMWSAGYGEYTFTVQEESTDAGTFPKVKITNPSSYQITMGVLNVTEGCAETLDGGTLTAKTVEKIENVDTDFTVSKDQYVREGGSVTFTATAYDGYDFAGFYSNADCTNPITDGVTNNTYTTTIIAATSVYAKFSERLYNVTYNNGETTTTIKAGVASHHQITAVQKDGKKFTGWETYGVSVANSTAKTTTISYVDMGVNDHRVTATYGDLDVIYFNNLSGSWNPSNMYVYFYKGAYPDFDAAGTGSQWDGGNTWAPTCMMNKGIPMTKIEGTNIWKAEYDKEDSEYFAYSSEDIKMVAFIDHEENLCDRFYACSLVYTEFYSCMNMFVLPDNSSFLKNTNACYYNKDGKGFWKNYETDNSGLFVNIYGGGPDRLSSTPMDQSEGEGWFSASVHLEPQGSSGEYDYYFIIGGCDGSNWSHKEGVVSKDANTITLHPYYKGENVYGEKVTIKTTAPGSYKFMVKHNDNNELDLKVEYPFNVNDYRVVSVVNGKAHDNGYIYKYSSTEKDDLASFFVKEGMTVKLQKCTAIAGLAVTWSDVAGQSISNFTANGYRNFTIHQDGNGSATLTAAGEYKGKFYLRTDVAPGGWSNYLTNAGNIMQENEYGMNDAQSFKFTHAYTNHVGHGGNVKFVIANDYSKCITDTLVKDNFITDNAGNLPSGKDANVRFMWNKNDNTVARAYIGGSALTTDRYLVLLGNKDNSNKSLMVDANGDAFPEGGTGRDGLHADEAIFTDLGNWIYQVNIKAFSGAAVKLMADFAGKTQYFVGAEGNETGSWRTIMAGSETVNPYTMRVVYDFKSNRLVAGFVPDGQEISSSIVLNGDLLILREMQEDAKQIKFGEAAQGQNPYSISQIDHIYCGLQINKGTAQDGKGMIGSSNSDYAKTMYWISFPFDVNINEIFGLDGYGQKWIIQKYNGKKRADIGWFKGDGTETFWEFMDYNETMKAYEGYLFLLDANYFNETNDKVWEIGTVDHITFYFPSASGNIGIINKSEYTQEVPAHKCDIKREFNIGTEQDPIIVSHEQTDSYWNVIGVPAFQNKTMALSETEVDTKMNAIYEWNSSENTYNVKALKTNFEFKTMYAYMVQFGGDITWSDVSVVNNPTKAQGGPAPKYAYADEKNYMIELFFNGNGAEDHTYINLADEASTDFVLNEDMMKIDNAGFPNIYSFAGNYNVAYNETKMDNQTVMLGVSAPKDGNYTFAMPKDFSGTAKLVDLVEGITTDLNVANYSVDLNKGTYNNRFQLVLEVEAKTPTSIEADGQRGREADGKTTKILRNGEIYLINGGRVYNVLGVEE